MKILSYIYKKIFLPACGIYTFITFAIITLANLASSLNIFDIAVPALTLSLMFLFFIISLVLAACNRILFIKKLSSISAVFIHMASVIISISLITLLYSSSFADYTINIKAVLFVVIFTFLYLIFCLPFAIASSILFRKKRPSAEKYVSIFSEDLKKKN